MFIKYAIKISTGTYGESAMYEKKCLQINVGKLEEKLLSRYKVSELQFVAR